MRDHWTLRPDLRYLNHGSFGAVPAVTQDAQRRLAEAAEANPMQWFRDLPARVGATRDIVGDYLGRCGGDIALVANATSGINIALRSVPASPGQTFVLTDHGYGAVALAARRVATERACRVVTVPLPLDATDHQVVAAIAEHIDDNTACVVLDQITSATAKVLPAQRVADLGRSRGVPVIVDGAHAPGLIDDPVIGDYWTGNLHKWPCAPRGCGVLYVDPARRQSVPPAVVSWGDPLGFPAAFDTPGTMDASGWLAAPTSLELLAALGFADRRQQLGSLLDAGADRIAAAVGGAVVDVATPAPTMRLVTLPSGLVTDDLTGFVLGEYLAERSSSEIQVASWRSRGFLRLSAHLYNTIDDYTVTAARYSELFSDPELPARLRERHAMRIHELSQAEEAHLTTEPTPA